MDENATIAPAGRYIEAVTSGSVLTCKAVQFGWKRADGSRRFRIRFARLPGISLGGS